MHAKVHPKGGKNEDEIQTRFKSRLNQQQLILNDPPMKIADFCCLWRCQNCFADAEKACPQQLPAKVAFPVDFDGEEWPGEKRYGWGGCFCHFSVLGEDTGGGTEHSHTPFEPLSGVGGFIWCTSDSERVSRS